MLSRAPLRFVVLIGVVSLFADATYEGARSIHGPFLATLGATGAAVGVVAGAGELLGYAVRLVSGKLAERTGALWTITICGYAVNLFAVPALALAGNWPLAAVLIILERVGKGVRVPPRDAMLSHATSALGHGRGFGLHEALDQIGAVLGPLVVAGVLAAGHPYRTGFAWLAVPALLAFAALAVARARYPAPRAFEIETASLAGHGYPQVFWVYLAAAGLIGLGFADFPLIAYHFQQAHIVGRDAVPVLYAVAMAVDALAALGLGWVFDRAGMPVLAAVTAVTAFFAPLVFLGGAAAAVAGMVLWGVGMGALESVLRAAVATMVHPDRRAGAYGVFNAGFGVAWFAGSAAIGGLYDQSRLAVAVFSLVAQLAAVPVLLVAHRLLRRVSAAPTPR